jgi:putative phosphoribosyl transferase
LVSIKVGGETREVATNILEADLAIPSNNNANTKGIVLFAHGSGSSRQSPRNKYVAEVLQRD